MGNGDLNAGNLSTDFNPINDFGFLKAQIMQSSSSNLNFFQPASHQEFKKQALKPMGINFKAEPMRTTINSVDSLETKVITSQTKNEEDKIKINRVLSPLRITSQVSSYSKLLHRTNLKAAAKSSSKERSR